MSSRKKVKEQNIVVAAIESIDRRMEDFIQAVEEFKTLKESIQDLHEEIVAKEAEHAAILEHLKTALKDNKIKVINDAVIEMNKMLVSKEEIDDYKSQIDLLKKELSTLKNTFTTSLEQKIQEQVATQKQVLQLEHQYNTAGLSAKLEYSDKEILNLKESITRLLAELESQKKLTAELGRIQAPVRS